MRSTMKPLACPQCGREDGIDGEYAVRECGGCGIEFRPFVRLPLRSVNRFSTPEIERDWLVRLPLAAFEIMLDWLPIAVLFASAKLGSRVWSAYDARGIWYAEHGNSWAILAGILVVVLTSSVAVAVLVNPDRRRRPVQWIAPTAIMLIAIAFIGVRWFHPGPTLPGAQAAFDAGDLARASAELDAVDRGWPGTPGALELRAALDLAQAKQRAREPTSDDRLLARIADGNVKTDTSMVLHRTWQDPEKRERGRRRALARARAIADDAWKRGDRHALVRVLEDTAGLDETFTEQTKQRVARLAAGSP